ncbi:hypothetical protein [Mycoplasmopsis alligatoris]|uniref:Uncharacterized protein n=1 Tax=Mycoplasmopsis alligatoris A21JP2 TaxID=747682 RepID=D4XW54_9BACT|nr:hypothetical protein [Mycoplasmopsis alligatoris]EFF41436.1 hypothetical protein MALL_0723 [Mycoplasmopsis alligatoris A21JP2]
MNNAILNLTNEELDKGSKKATQALFFSTIFLFSTVILGVALVVFIVFNEESSEALKILTIIIKNLVVTISLFCILFYLIMSIFVINLLVFTKKVDLRKDFILLLIGLFFVFVLIVELILLKRNFNNFKDEKLAKPIFTQVVEVEEEVS